MIEIRELEGGDAMAGNGPLNLSTGGSTGRDELHISATDRSIGADFSSLDVEPSGELHTYIRHLDQKIDNLTSTIEDRAV
ncbi:hypothetical protein RHMOL_Rhmol03G0139300 [Rhododendron molle]|uniref:Uncharacterized protein n=1 Tax=Rhododendron molle TaxID=49168 RepID=A0ACC0PDV4_RHOML|nr:hypothetical protein RHMOL_Rhmol03G0139300 [Rhododendron molle]